MPALVLFGRRWYVGSDDFVIPAFFDLLFRLGWLIAVAVVYLNSDANLSIEGERGFYIKMYLYGVFAALHLIIFFDIALIHNSKAGSVLDKHARRFVPLCIYCRLLFQLLEITWTSIGTVGIFNGMLLHSYAKEVGNLIIGLVISNWLLAIIGLILLYLSFDPSGGYKYTLEDNGLAHPQVAKEWKRKFSLFSCLYSGSRMAKKEAFEEVGYLFAALFEDVDMVPSDVVAGFMLILLKNESIKRNKLKLVKTNSVEKTAAIRTEGIQGQAIEWPPTEEWNSIPVIFYMKKYAISVYNWPLVIVGHSKPIRSLWKNSFCCGCMRQYPAEIVGDNCCFLKTSGLRSMVDMENSDFIYASFRNPLFENPFIVVVDHPTKSVIVAIRGTLSLEDLLVDGNAKPYPIPGLPDSFKAHHGILRCAQSLKEKLESLKLLPKLFVSNPDYNLVLTGQSLGAGAASILGLMMRNDYPNLKCYSYAPPGGLLSADAAKACESFVISVIYGDDLVSRMGIYSIEKLKYQMMEELNRCRTPKYRIFLGDLYWICGGFPKMKYDENSDLQTSGIDAQDTKAIEQEKTISTAITMDSDPDKDNDDTVIETFELLCPQFSLNLQAVEENNNKNIKQEMQKQPAKVSNNVPEFKKLMSFEDLYPPGKLLYITETDCFKSGRKNASNKGDPRWTIRWAETSEFREFKLTPRMLFDHLPLRMYKALQDLTLRFNAAFGSNLNPNASPVIDNCFMKKYKS